ncbi:MAG TPA: hypothetical protein VMI75_05250 [Polyangiaceae bacterium]|nr:hypothetical protein [Polyangiaceae bacterium]
MTRITTATTAPEVIEARRGAATAAIIAMLGQTTLAVVDDRALGFSALVAARIAHVALASIALALIWLRPPSIRGAEVAFALAAIPFQLVLLVSELEFHARGDVRDHGSWYQLTMLGIATLAPADPMLPAFLVVTLGVQRVVLRYLLGVVPLAPGEPWLTLIFAAVAVGMLVSRARRREFVANAARVAAHAAALERVARLLLLVRDRANSPLQTVALGAAIMRRRCPDQQRVASAMDRAVRRLRKLSKALQRASRSFERAPL